MKFIASAGLALRKYANVIIVFIILLISFLIRLIYLDSNDLALDEPFSVFHAQMSVGDIITRLRGLNNPPLNEIILHFWIRVFGFSVFSVRFPALIFGVLNLWLVYLLARKMFEHKIALLALLLVAFSNYHLYFSHEARVYSLFALLTTWSFYLLIKIFRRETKIYGYILLYICYVLLIFAHYFGMVVLLLHAAFLLFLLPDEKDIRKRYFITLAGVVLSYAYYIPEIVSRFLESSREGTWLQPVENLGNLHDLVFLFANQNRLTFLMIILLLWGAVWKFFYLQKMNNFLRWDFIYGIVPVFFLTSFSIYYDVPLIWKITSNPFYIWFFVLLILGAFIVFLFKYRFISVSPIILIGWFILPLTLFFLVSFTMPVFLDRYLVFIMPAFYILLAWLTQYLFPGRLFWGGGAVLLLLMLASFNADEPNHRDVGRLGQEARIFREDNANKILICPEQFKHTFSYHYSTDIFRDYRNLDRNLRDEGIYFIYDSVNVNDILEPADSLVLFIDARGRFLFPDNGIIRRLNREFGPASVYVYEDSIYLYKYRKSYRPD